MRAGEPAGNEAALHAAKPREHIPAALPQHRLVCADDRLGLALCNVNRFNLSRPPAPRMQRAPEQLRAWRGGCGAPCVGETSKPKLNRSRPLRMRMGNQLFRQSLQVLGVAHRGQLTLGFVAA